LIDQCGLPPPCPGEHRRRRQARFPSQPLPRPINRVGSALRVYHQPPPHPLHGAHPRTPRAPRPPTGRHGRTPRLTPHPGGPTTIGESERAARRIRAAERRPLGILDEFEKGLERVVNGAFAKTFKSGLQPLEVTAALRRELDTKAAVVARDRILAPNRFVVRLAPSDFERMSGLGPALIDEFTRLV